MNRLGLSVVVMSLVSSFAFSQPTDTLKIKRFRLSPLPVIYYSPETRLGFGALLAANFEMNKVPDSVTSSCYAQLYGLYTINKQYDLGFSTRIYGTLNRYILTVRANYTFFPEYFFGTNTNNPEPLKDTINYNRQSLDTRWVSRIRPGLYLGGALRYNRIYDVDTGNPLGSLEVLHPPGFEGYSVVGFGPGLTLETRDSQVYPRSGHLLEIQSYLYPDWNNSGLGFFNLKIDARKYYPLKIISPNDVVAIQFLANLNSGTIPFKDMADVGGSYTMRGYYTGFYRYANLYALQSEFRGTIWKRLGFSVWLGAALNSDKWYKPLANPVRPNGGAGLRIMINTRDKLNIRVDQGYGNRKQQGLYLDISEAF